MTNTGTDIVSVHPTAPPKYAEDFNLASGGCSVDADPPPLILAPRLIHVRSDWGDVKTWLIILACASFGVLLALAAISLPAGQHAAVPTIKLY